MPRGDQLTYHPIAECLPKFTVERLRELADDIREHGLREPIVTFQGKILDGRNRSAACFMAGVEPHYREFAGDLVDAVEFVASQNLQRRDLDKGQRAIAKSRLDKERGVAERLRDEAAERQREGGKKAGRGRRQKVSQIVGKPVAEKNTRSTNGTRAKAAGVSHESIRVADRIVEQRPDLADDVQAGNKTLAQAKREMERDQRRKELEAKAKTAKAKPAGWKIRKADVMTGLASLDDGEANLVFADPPYNIGIDYGKGAKADKLPDAKYLDWCEQWLRECVRVLADDGSLWVMIGDEYAGEYSVLLKRLGVHRRAWVKWYETFGVNQAKNFNRCSRHVFYCVKDRKPFTFHPEAVSRPSDRQTKYGDKRADPNGKVWDDVWQVPRLVGTSKERMPDFPTQIPLAILEPVVACSSNPGDLVVDPFSGSASTGAAAIKLGREYYGIERETKFVTASKLRLKAVQADLESERAS